MRHRTGEPGRAAVLGALRWLALVALMGSFASIAALVVPPFRVAELVCLVVSVPVFAVLNWLTARMHEATYHVRL